MGNYYRNQLLKSAFNSNMVNSFMPDTSIQHEQSHVPAIFPNTRAPYTQKLPAYNDITTLPRKQRTKQSWLYPQSTTMPIRHQPNMKPPMNINGARPNWPLPNYSGLGKSASLYAPPNSDFPGKHGFDENTGLPVPVPDSASPQYTPIQGSAGTQSAPTSAQSVLKILKDPFQVAVQNVLNRPASSHAAPVPVKTDSYSDVNWPSIIQRAVNGAVGRSPEGENRGFKNIKDMTQIIKQRDDARQQLNDASRQNWLTKFLNWFLGLFGAKQGFSYGVPLNKGARFILPPTEQQLVKVASLLKYYK